MSIDDHFYWKFLKAHFRRRENCPLSSHSTSNALCCTCTHKEEKKYLLEGKEKIDCSGLLKFNDVYLFKAQLWPMKSVFRSIKFKKIFFSSLWVHLQYRIECNVRLSKQFYDSIINYHSMTHINLSSIVW